jgi:hypothetical protein
VAVAVTALLFFLGMLCAFTPPHEPCDCRRCWYVNEPPEGAPVCKTVKTIAIAGIAALAFWLLRSPASGFRDQA